MDRKGVFTASLMILALLPPASAVEREDITKPATSGLYSDYETRIIYNYDSATGSLAPTGLKVPPRQTTNETDGQCLYSDNLFGQPSYQVAGRCIGLRPLSDGRSLIRIGVQEIETEPMKASLYHEYRNSTGVGTGSVSQIYLCDGTGVPSAPVKRCHIEVDRPRLVAPAIPFGSTEVCRSLALFVWNGASYGEPVLEVVAPCAPM